jgi:hypothetical protein
MALSTVAPTPLAPSATTHVNPQTSNSGGPAVTMSDLKRALEESIAALHRRVPQVEQGGETAIARDGAALRAKAIVLADLADDSAVAGSGGRGDLT